MPQYLEMSRPLQFPGQSAIHTHLERHPKSNDQWLKSNRILALVAKAFAYQDMTPTEIKRRVATLLKHSGLNFTEETIDPLSEDLATALRACPPFKSRL